MKQIIINETASSCGKKDKTRFVCPFCNEVLHMMISRGWVCECGEIIPFGMEKDDVNCTSHYEEH